MRIPPKLSPGFLKRIDRWLLSTAPWIWATRIHHQLFFALVLYGLFALIALVYPVSLIDIPDLEEVTGWLYIPATVWAGFLIYSMAIFSVEKRFGKRVPLQGVWEGIIYFFNFALVAVFP